MGAKKMDLLRGTLDLLILQVLQPLHVPSRERNCSVRCVVGDNIDVCRLHRWW